jgi:hypothetical protein
MLPFGVTIPRIVPQRSEIPEELSFRQRAVIEFLVKEERRFQLLIFTTDLLVLDDG